MKDTKNMQEELQSETIDTIEVSDEINDNLASLTDLSRSISPALQESVASMGALSRSISPTLQESVASMSALSDYMKSFNLNEILETIQAFSNIDTSTIEESTDTDELLHYIENEIAESYDNKISLKTFINQIAITFGITTVIAIITAILIPYLLTFYPNILENHQMVVDTLQETINSLISTFGDNLIAKATVRDVIEEQTLSDYEHLNLIGILRVDTFIRKGSSKNAPLAIPNKLKANTVVNLLELSQKLNVKRKQNWLKVNVKIDDDYVEGWVEESKVQRFKKVN